MSPLVSTTRPTRALASRRQHDEGQSRQQRQRPWPRRDAAASLPLANVHVVDVRESPYSHHHPQEQPHGRQHRRRMIAARTLIPLFVLSACMANYIFLSRKQNPSLYTTKRARSTSTGNFTITVIADDTTTSPVDPPKSKDLDTNATKAKELRDDSIVGSFPSLSKSRTLQSSSTNNSHEKTIERILQNREAKNDTKHRNSRNDKMKSIKTSSVADRAVHQEPRLNILNYAPSRIPGYIVDVHHQNQTLQLFGYVMRDFVTRILTRNPYLETAPSKVLVVSPEAPSVVQLLQKQPPIHSEEDKEDNRIFHNPNIHQGPIRRQIHHAIGGSTLVYAHSQGHQYVGLDGTKSTINRWWKKQKEKQLQHHDQPQSSENPNDSSFLLTMMVGFNEPDTLDTMVAQSMPFFKEAVVDYIVLGIGAQVVPSYPSDKAKQDTYYDNEDDEGDDIVEVWGQEAILQLLSLNYKVQLLSLSHLSQSKSYKKLLRPNALITKYNQKQFWDGLQDLAMESSTSSSSNSVLGLVFATMGLDLAIPSALTYQPTLTKSRGITYRVCPDTQVVIQFLPKRRQANSTVTASSLPPKATARTFSRMTKLPKKFKGPNTTSQFNIGQALLARQAKQAPSKSPQSTLLATQILVGCQGKAIPRTTTTAAASEKMDLWYSGKTLETSEAVCLRVVCGTSRQAACKARILRKSSNGLDSSSNVSSSSSNSIGRADNTTYAIEHRRWADPDNTTSNESPSANQSNQQQQPNLLLLRLDHISLARFERSLVKTNRLLRMLNFTSFSQFTAVETDSGPSQAVLFGGGKPTSGQSTTHRPPLLKILKENGYMTFEAEDRCHAAKAKNTTEYPLSNSSPVDHGPALMEMLCYDFQYPNCVGDTSAAKFLLDHAAYFSRVYERHHQPWAAFLNFVDPNEDTQTLEGVLDEALWKFLFQFHQAQKYCGMRNAKLFNPFPCSVWDNTMIVLVSEQGMAHGNYALSPQGSKERVHPMLHAHLPKSHASSFTHMEQNKDAWVTPLDAYQTILEVLLEPGNELLLTRQSNGEGTSLLQPLPSNRKNCKTTPEIPANICDLLNGNFSESAMTPFPPSVLSFYSDIPAANKHTLSICDQERSDKVFKNLTGQCLCATDKRPWHRCLGHPWTKTSNKTLAETFALIDCKEERSFEIQVRRDPAITNRPEVAAVQREERITGLTRPNILILELDSVSRAYADRHFPRTREVLESMRLRRSKTDPSGFTCNTNETLCAAEFTAFSVVGPASIPNQVATFGGCMITTGPERCQSFEKDSLNRTICTDRAHAALGMERVSQHRTSDTFCPTQKDRKSPWIFDIAKTNGYVTLFAEEFCYEESVYVPQGNIFPLNADILPSKLFCRIAQRRAARLKIPMVLPSWQYEYKPHWNGPACVDEWGGYDGALIGLDHIESMWNAYQDIPKLAYLNAMAAHMYRPYEGLAKRAEVYDAILSAFLERMLARNDMQNTILIIRADHGLQSGPTMADYSMQIEALRPFTEIVVPKKLQGLSLQTLYKNQHHLTTSFDIYNTITAAMVKRNGNSLNNSPTPPWSHNLLIEKVPENRTCAAAKVRAEYCLLENERIFSAPNLKTCNLAEEEQRLICPPFMEDFQNEMSVKIADAFDVSDRLQEKACPRNSTTEVSVPSGVLVQWSRLEKFLNADPERRLSPRQSSILSTILEEMGTILSETEKRPLRVCLAGFESGHAAALFLGASDNTELHLFDSLKKADKKDQVKFLQLKYGRKRLVVHHNNPCQAMQQVLSPDIANSSNNYTEGNTTHCDFVHTSNTSSSTCPLPVIDLVKNSPCGILVSSQDQGIKSLRNSSIFFGGKDSQWNQLRAGGCIKDITCFGDISTDEKFCLAISTGSCQPAFQSKSETSRQRTIREQCDSRISQMTEHLTPLDQLCPAQEIHVPLKPRANLDVKNKIRTLPR